MLLAHQNLPGRKSTSWPCYFNANICLWYNLVQISVSGSTLVHISRRETEWLKPSLFQQVKVCVVTRQSITGCLESDGIRWVRSNQEWSNRPWVKKKVAWAHLLGRGWREPLRLVSHRTDIFRTQSSKIIWIIWGPHIHMGTRSYVFVRWFDQMN